MFDSDGKFIGTAEDLTKFNQLSEDIKGLSKSVLDATDKKTSVEISPEVIETAYEKGQKDFKS
jgi:hypothetical protein